MRLLCSVLFLMFCLVSNVHSQQHDSLFMVSAVTKLKNSKEYTLQVADLMPAQQYGFRPTKDEMSFGEQLIHISANLGWLTSSYLSEGVNPVSKEDSKISQKDSIRSVIVRTYDYAISVLQQFPIEQLGDSVKFFAGPMSKLQIINLVSDHQTHHRGQLLVYLRLSGLTPPKYIGW